MSRDDSSPGLRLITRGARLPGGISSARGAQRTLHCNGLTRRLCRLTASVADCYARATFGLHLPSCGTCFGLRESTRSRRIDRGAAGVRGGKARSTTTMERHGITGIGPSIAVSSSDVPWYRTVTREQWRVLIAAKFGWMLDAMDFMLYTMAVGQLRICFGFGDDTAGMLGTVTLIMSGVGGTLFGYVADRFGRTRALMGTILIFSLASLGAATSQSVMQLLFWRAVLGIGMGGEWASGAVLVSETWPAHLRNKAISIMQSGWALGYMMASISPRSSSARRLSAPTPGDGSSSSASSRRSSRCGFDVTSTNRNRGRASHRRPAGRVPSRSSSGAR